MILRSRRWRRTAQQSPDPASRTWRRRPKPTKPRKTTYERVASLLLHTSQSSRMVKGLHTYQKLVHDEEFFKWLSQVTTMLTRGFARLFIPAGRLRHTHQQQEERTCTLSHLQTFGGCWSSPSWTGFASSFRFSRFSSMIADLDAVAVPQWWGVTMTATPTSRRDWNDLPWRMATSLTESTDLIGSSWENSRYEWSVIEVVLHSASEYVSP